MPDHQMTSKRPSTLNYSSQIDRETVILPTRFSSRAFFLYVIVANTLISVCISGFASWASGGESEFIATSLAVCLTMSTLAGVCLALLTDTVLMKLKLRAYDFRKKRSARKDFFAEIKWLSDL